MTDWNEVQRSWRASTSMSQAERGIHLTHEFGVLDPIEPGYSVRVATTAGYTAGTSEAVADSLPYTDEQARIVVEDSDRIDPDVMEHTRQSRLRSWQEQRPEVNSRRDDA